MLLEPLTAVSSIDGRYRGTVAVLADHFSELALMRKRLIVECEYLIALSETRGVGLRKLSEEEKNAQWDRELDSITEADWDRFYFNCTGRHLGDPFPEEELVDMDEFLENPDKFQ